MSAANVVKKALSQALGGKKAAPQPQATPQFSPMGGGGFTRPQPY